jgi:UDP-arabinose 4-epimerase
MRPNFADGAAHRAQNAHRTAMSESFSSPARILVTGASGYVGSATTRALGVAGYHVVALDRQAPRDPETLGMAEFVLMDIREERRVLDTLLEHEITAVVHIAGLKSVAESFRDPARYFDHNFSGSVHVLSAMAAASVRNFVFSSSAAVYGSPASLPITEDAPMRPMNPYGESKALVEHVLPWFLNCHGIEYVTLRYFNAAGATSDGRFGEDWSGAVNLIPVAIRAALTDETVELFGSDYPTPDGTAIRDYVHVADLAAGHVAAIRYLAAGGRSEVFNLGTGRGASVAEVLAAVQQKARGDLKIADRPRRIGDAPAAWADISRAERVLGWRPANDLNAIVDSAWRWHEQQRRLVRVAGSPSDGC